MWLLGQCVWILFLGFFCISCFILRSKHGYLCVGSSPGSALNPHGRVRKKIGLRKKSNYDVLQQGPQLIRELWSLEAPLELYQTEVNKGWAFVPCADHLLAENGLQGAGMTLGRHLLLARGSSWRRTHLLAVSSYQSWKLEEWVLRTEWGKLVLYHSIYLSYPLHL